MPAIFNPTLSTQRYLFVEKFLIERPHLTSLTDVGCGMGRMVRWIKTVPTVERMNCLDVDYNLLDWELGRYLQPSLIEAVFGRKCSDKEFTINVFYGDAAIPDDRLKADCFSLVEMIEHITLEELETLSRTIFSYYQPKHVIVTTPNFEFNHLLNHQDPEEDRNNPRDPDRKFRHFDHKFEWTRAEFNQWAQYVCTTYNYEYYMDGVGHLPGSEPFGPCTQIAVFTRKSDSPTAIEQGDLACFDLLLNKLSFECLGEPRKKRIGFICEFSIPGNLDTTPYPVIDWSSSSPEKEMPPPPRCDDPDCDLEYCSCKGNLADKPTSVSDDDMDDYDMDDNDMEEPEVQQDFQGSNAVYEEIEWW